MALLVLAAIALGVGGVCAGFATGPRARAWMAVASQATSAALAAAAAFPALTGAPDPRLAAPSALFLVFSLLLTLLATVEALVCAPVDALTPANATRQFSGLNGLALALVFFYGTTSAGAAAAAGLLAAAAWALLSSSGRRKTVVARRRGALAHGLIAQALIALALRFVATSTTPTSIIGWVVIIAALACASVGSGAVGSRSDVDRLCTGSALINIGLAGVGLGTGLLGLARGDSELAAFALTGCLLHAINLSVFGGLLSSACNAVANAAGSNRIGASSGLLRELPWTGISFLVGALSASGLPPLNGFISLFLISAALVHAGSTALLVVLALCATGLALNGAALTDAFGKIFLGAPPPLGRRASIARARLRPLPTAAYVVACSVLGALPAAALGLVAWPMRAVCLQIGMTGPAPLSGILAVLAPVSAVTGALVGGFMALAFARSVVLP